MHKRGYILLIFYCVMITNLWAQVNLIPNGDFEYYSDCPGYENELYNLNKAVPWFNPTLNTPDYFNACDSLIPSYASSGVPDNFEGSQYPHSGFGYAGISVHSGTENG